MLFFTIQFNFFVFLDLCQARVTFIFLLADKNLVCRIKKLKNY